MVSFHFDVDVVENFEHACNANADLFKKLFHGVLEKGVYFAPSAFESLFLSHTHSKELLDKTINAMDKTFEEIL
jgi:glutamate-1-semialdehyde 2,1-aminomutase